MAITEGQPPFEVHASRNNVQWKGKMAENPDSKGLCGKFSTFRCLFDPFCGFFLGKKGFGARLQGLRLAGEHVGLDFIGFARERR